MLTCQAQLGSTAVGVRTSEGVILAVEKRVTSPLMEVSSIEKILEVALGGRTLVCVCVCLSHVALSG